MSNIIIDIIIIIGLIVHTIWWLIKLIITFPIGMILVVITYICYWICSISSWLYNIYYNEWINHPFK